MRHTSDITKRLNPGDYAIHFNGLSHMCKKVKVTKTTPSDQYPDEPGFDFHWAVDDNGDEIQASRFYLYVDKNKLIPAIEDEIIQLNYLMRKIEQA